MDVTKKLKPGKTVPLCEGFIDVIAVRGNVVVVRFRGYSDHIQVVNTIDASNNQAETIEQSG